jgi:hypothetical protein
VVFGRHLFKRRDNVGGEGVLEQHKDVSGADLTTAAWEVAADVPELKWYI